MVENKIYRENGKLKIQFTINKTKSMLEMEEQIEVLVNSVKNELTDMELIKVKEQLLNSARLNLKPT